MGSDLIKMRGWSVPWMHLFILVHLLMSLYAVEMGRLSAFKWSGLYLCYTNMSFWSWKLNPVWKAVVQYAQRARRWPGRVNFAFGRWDRTDVWKISLCCVLVGCLILGLVGYIPELYISLLPVCKSEAYEIRVYMEASRDIPKPCIFVSSDALPG